jgi:hypothetical protein
MKLEVTKHLSFQAPDKYFTYQHIVLQKYTTSKWQDLLASFGEIQNTSPDSSVSIQIIGYY